MTVEVVEAHLVEVRRCGAESPDEVDDRLPVVSRDLKISVDVVAHDGLLGILSPLNVGVRVLVEFLAHIQRVAVTEPDCVSDG